VDFILKMVKKQSTKFLGLHQGEKKWKVLNKIIDN
jgi:hypothetical protein